MSGHILPVIFSWHLDIELNAVAKHAAGAFDPDAFWLAWDRGAAVGVDTFGPSWDFWAVVGEPLAELRQRCAIPPLPTAADGTVARLERSQAGIATGRLTNAARPDGVTAAPARAPPNPGPDG